MNSSSISITVNEGFLSVYEVKEPAIKFKPIFAPFPVID
jgi:hypothetical protein